MPAPHPLALYALASIALIAYPVTIMIYVATPSRTASFPLIARPPRPWSVPATLTRRRR